MYREADRKASLYRAVREPVIGPSTCWGALEQRREPSDALAHLVFWGARESET